MKNWTDSRLMMKGIERSMDKQKQSRPVVLAGLGQGSLQVGRILGKTGIPVFGIARHPSQIATKSRFIRTIGFPRTEHELFDILMEFSTASNTKPVLFLMSDYYISFFLEHQKALSNAFAMPALSPDLLQKLLSKTGSARLFKAIGLPTPLTLELRSGVMSAAIQNHVPIPCVAKPEYHEDWEGDPSVVSMLERPDDRVLFFKTKEQLHSCICGLNRGCNLVIQEYIPGPSTSLLYYVGYRDRAGRVATSFVGQKLRSYPDCLGSETLLMSVRQPDVVELGDSILNKLNYYGPAGIDFKYDYRDSSFKVIEINCRLGINDAYLVKAGINLPLLYYWDSQQLEVPLQKEYPAGITWYDFQRDLEWMRYHGKAKGISWLSWCRQLARRHASYATFDWSDPWPFAIGTMQLCKRMIQKMLRPRKSPK